MRGAVSLPPDGTGYELMRLSRGRFYGHPNLTRFVEELGRAVARKKLGALLIGDMGQARGGPSNSNHRSHQTGLDVDIWFDRAPRAGSLRLDERETLEATSVVAASGDAVEPTRWSPVQAKVLRLAAEHSEVERIFVNAAIKKALCASVPPQPGKRAWLAKLRPWWGHDDHFHVRLRCPTPACKAQEPIPAGDGCDSTLDWWFSAEAKAKGATDEKGGAPTFPELPVACAELLKL